VVDLLGFVFLFLFFALEAPQIVQSGESGTPPLFGTLNDASFIVVALCLLPVALALHEQERVQSPTGSRITLMIGILGMLNAAAVQALYVPRVISTAQQSPLLNLSIGTIGLWLLLVNVLGRGTAILRGLAWLGIGIGVCLLLLPLTYFAGGGAALLDDASASLSNPLVIIGFATAMLGLGLAYPVWAILVGRRFLLRRVDNARLEPLTA
jgi:hypothetical protein